MTVNLPTTTGVPAAYRPLYRYLETRFADAVVLTFAEIEDLIGVPLPDAARHQLEWWTNDAAAGATAAHAQAWTMANRLAVPRFAAKTVRFDRGPSRS